ncbi:MAG TPA: hypothetical protein VFQ61_26020 [Polyangiaceae bacterium]|nr:hypothetical protein [Polyangiaceae bacterium]
MSARIATLLDEVRAKILLGCESIVRLAAQREVLHRVLAASRKRFHVVELEPMCLSATLP